MNSARDIVARGETLIPPIELLQDSMANWGTFPLAPPKYICVFQVSRPYLGFCPDPKHFIVNCEQNVVNFAEKMGENVLKNAISV